MLRFARRSLLLMALGVILVLVGAYLALGGIWLIFIGGSWFYFPLGVAVGASGVLLARGDPRALWLYAALTLLTLLWSLWEVGLDWWPLAARMSVLFVLGLILVSPWVTRALTRSIAADAERRAAGAASPRAASTAAAAHREDIPPGDNDPSPELLPHALYSPRVSAMRGAGLPVSVALLAFTGVAVASWFTDPHDIEGVLPPQRSAGTDIDPAAPPVPPGEWHAYGRTGYGQRYSPLTQINPQNVGNLREVWRFQTGDVRGRPGDPEETTFQATPLKIGNALFFCTPYQSVIALDATTGRQLWRYDPLIQGELALQHLTCRGLSYHDGQRPDAPPAQSATMAADASSQAGPAPAADAPEGEAALPLPPDGETQETATPPAGEPAAPGPDAAPVEEEAQDIEAAAPNGASSPEPAPEPAPQPGPDVDGSARERAAPTNAPPGTGAIAQELTRFTHPGQPIAAADAHATRDDCTAKLFMPTADARVIALSPEDGAVCTNFGDGTGQINLWANMPNVGPGGYYSTSPVVVTRSAIIVAGTVLDNVSTAEPSGVVRAFDVDTGELLWNWDAANPEDTAPIAADGLYTPNSPNSWAISSVDEALGMVYVPMGNQPPDQWGGDRSPEAEEYSSAVVALDIATGEVRWHFRTVHHDLWDYDVPAQPSLIDLTIDGQRIPALVQPTKQGEIFVLDRRDGTPVLPVHEVPVPQGAVEGDFTAPTQPRSALSFDPPRLTGASMWGATLFDQLACRISFHRLRYEGRYTPPSLRGSLIYPGNFGTFNWGGVAVDPQREVVFATPTRLAFVSQMVPREDDTTYYVQDEDPQGALPALNENFGAPYAVRMSAFLSPLGLPCQAPPWGFIAGADLTTGETAWRYRNGTVRDNSPLPLPFRMGVPNLGGPIVTAGGVAFLSSTLDNYVRAYDVTNGQQLWQSRLPAGGQATPMTYVGADNRQYVLVVAGGHGSLGTKPGDYVIVYAVR